MKFKSRLSDYSHFIVRIILISAISFSSLLWLISNSLHQEKVFGATTSLFVQEKDKEVTSGTSNAVTFASSTSAGNLIVVYVIWDNSSTVTISDSARNTFASAVGPTIWDSRKYSTQIFYANNIRGGADTITARFSTAIKAFGIVFVHEYTQIDPVTPIDVTAAAIGSGTSANSGMAHTTSAADLLFAGGVSANMFTSRGAGYIARSTLEGNLTEDQLVSTQGAYSATATNSSGLWGMQFVAFRVVSSLPADVTPPSTPTGLSASVISSSQINLSWAASTDSTSPASQISYNIYRNGSLSGSTAPGVTSWQDTSRPASTTYTYAVQAKDAAGNLSELSQSIQATTAVPAPVIAFFRANPTTILTGQSTTLSWSVSNATSLILNNGLGNVTSLSSINASPTSTTKYILTASNSTGTTTAQVVVSVSSDTTPPSVPRLNAVSVSPSQVNLSWTASTDNVGIAGYQIYRNNALLAQVNTTSYTDAGLDSNISYTYAVAAYDAAGNFSAQSAPVTIPASGGSDTQPPTVAITSPTNNQPLSGTVIVTANATDNVGVTNVQFLLDGSALGTSNSTPYSISWNTTQAADGSHVLSAVASDAAGNTATSFSVSVNVGNNFGKSYMTNFPATENPISENGNWINGGTVGLDWNNVLTVPGTAEGVGPSSITYSDPTAILSGTWGPDQTVTETVYSNGVEDKQTTGFDKEVEIRLRTSISPHKITGYEINCRTPNDSLSYIQIVRWNGALGDFTSLNILRGTGCANGDILKASISGSTINVYRNGTLLLTAEDSTFTSGNPGIGFNFGCGTEYNQFGITNYTATDSSTTVDTTPPSTPIQLSATAVSSSQINLSWTASTDNVSVVGYQVFRNGDQIATSGGSNYSDTGLTADTQYSYTVAAYDAAGLVSQQSTPATATTIALDTTPPSVPIIQQSLNVASTSASISWSASSDNVAVAGYQVFRDGTQVGTITGTTYTDNGLTPHTTYSYTVAAFDFSNNISSQSPTFQVTTTTDGSAPPSFVQVNQNQITKGTSVTASFNSTTTSGNTLVVYAIWSNTSSATITDSHRNTFIPVSAPIPWSGKYNAQVFYASNITGGTDKITATFKTSVSSFGVLYIHEYSGISTMNPVDVTASATGSSSILNSGTATTTTPNDLLFGAGVSDNAVTTSGSGLTARDLSFGNITEDGSATSAGPYSATAEHNGKSWGMQLIAFRPAN